MSTNTLDIVDNPIQTCRDGEEGYRSAAEHKYQDAMAAGLPIEVQRMVERQADRINVAHIRVATLLAQFKKAA
jgi:hypothetical protein